MKRFLENVSKILIGVGLITAVIFLINSEEEQDRDNYKDASLVASQYELTRFDRNEKTDDGFDLIDISVLHELKDGGNYILSGESNDIFVIDVEEQVAHIVLNGVTFKTETECAIFIKSAGKVVITLADETENLIVCSGAMLSGCDANGAIHAECDLTINGSGSLFVYGYGKDAIYSKDIIKIVNGNYDMFGARDGIRGNDGIAIYGGNAKVQANECGLHTTKSETGNIVITGGNVKFISKEYGIYAANDLAVEECLFFSYGTTTATYAGGIQQIDIECWQNYTEENGIEFVN